MAEDKVEDTATKPNPGRETVEILHGEDSGDFPAPPDRGNRQPGSSCMRLSSATPAIRFETLPHPTGKIH